MNKTMGFARIGTLALALAGFGITSAPTDARACGGCFAPPGAAQVVTDHRMVLAVSPTQTTLWDQFQYSGSPDEFSWILPIRYTESTRVEVASDDFLTLLTNVLVPAMNRPAPPPFPPGCEPPWAEDSLNGGARADAAAPSFADATADAGVTVLRQEVVGPYAVAIVRGTTGMGLRDWLRMNGYVIPSAVEPVIDHYLGLSMDFVALRLRAGKGLNRMVPVRITLDGTQPRLPLRMIAAGVADRVGLSLTVIAPSRYEAANFPNGQFANTDFTYDWNRPPGDLGAVFLEAFNARNRDNGNRLWLTESAMNVNREQLSFLAQRLPQRQPFGPDGGTRSSTAAEDVATAFMGLGTSAIATRLRADMPARMLDRDLDLRASDLGLRDRTYTFGRELNRPMYSACPWPPRMPDAGMRLPIDPPTPDAGAPEELDAGDGPLVPRPMDMTGTTSTAGGFVCAARPGTRGDATVLLAGVGLAALVSAARRRRR